MKTLVFDGLVEEQPDLRVDATLGDTAILVLLGLRDTRRLRATFMDMARIASGKQFRRVVLILEQPSISDRRLHDEWLRAARVIRPELFEQMILAVFKSGRWTGFPGDPDGEVQKVAGEILHRTRARQPIRTNRESWAHFDILRILIHQWLLGAGPVTIRWLMETSGTSYPTVSGSLKRLDHYLDRLTDRRVELRLFPQDEWGRLLAVSDEVRGTVRFADRSGQPRTPESLLERLRRLDIKGVAIGGVQGARHYLPDLGLVGTPRLDLTIHAAGRTVDLSFVPKLDPALAPAKRHESTPILVVHTLRRTDPLFVPEQGSLPWADPVECLLDLHEARLEDLAQEFLDALAGHTRSDR